LPSGSQALYNNTTGGPNDAFGYQALANNGTGGANDAFGYQALYSNTTGFFTTATGSQALASNTTGTSNTAVGAKALISNTTGSNLTCIGYSCTASDALTYATAIGAHAVVEQSNSLVLGGSGQYAVKVGIGTTTPSNVLTIAQGARHPVSDSWETYSSRRWKTNIHPLENPLSKVERLRGVSYDLKDSGKHEIGVIAEEVGKVVPEVVSYEDNGKDARGVDYSRLTALLIEATKEQQREIRQQQALLRTQAAAIRDLKSELRVTRQTLQKVQAQVAATQPALVAAK
jgi:Chaperone of endosialidase